MKKIAIIGAGISGLSIAHCLKERYDITVFESASKPGGLIKCEYVGKNLYHTVGGHVFNSKRQDVLNWFWSFFDRENEFVKANRNASVFFPDKHIAYPVENHIYEMNDDLQKKIVRDLISIAKNENQELNNFEDFLKSRFGNTLYEIYFKPYNQKIWKQDLSTIPLGWLEGKLPMPTVEEIIYNNFRREKETQMVHSSFYYAKTVNTRIIIRKIKDILEKHNIYLLGRFAEWEYYNMDAAMGAAIDLSKRF
jgi:protoporphyrinogen oxidase